MKLNLLSGVLLATVAFGCNQQGAQLSSKMAAGSIVIKTDNISAKTADAIPAGFVNNTDMRVSVNNPTITFHTSIALRNDIYGKKVPSNKPLIRVTVVNSKGEEVERQQREGVDIDWEAHLIGGDGNFDVKANLVNGNSVDERFEAQVFRFRLDTTPPVISSSSTLKTNADNAGRQLTLNVKALDDTATTCKSVAMPGIVSDIAPIDIELKAAATDPAKPLEHNFASDTETLAESFPNMLLVKTSCTDLFGQTSEITEAVSFAQPQFNINGTITAEKTIPYEDRAAATAQQRYMLRTGTGAGGAATLVKLSLKLTDKTTAAETNAAVVAREKNKLQVYLSNYEFTNIRDTEVQSDATKRLFMRKLFESALETSIPSSLTGKQTLYLSMTQIRESDGQEVLVGSHPLAVYVEPNGQSFEYEWKSNHQFVPAALNATLASSVRIKPAAGTGAPMKQWPTVEYSTDGSTWTQFTAASVTNWTSVSGESDTYAFEVKYPFANERPFRIRVVGTSAAGNVSASGPGKNLVAPPSFSTNTSACSGAGLFVAKGSSFLCKKDVLGATKYFAMIVAKNAGNAAFIVPETSDCYFPSRKCIVLSDTRNSASYTEKVDATPFVAPTFANQAQIVYLYGSLAKDEIATHTNYGATFRVNGPTCAATPTPSVILKGAGVTLQEGPFNCE